MNFFLPLFKSKLDAMRAAAPRATLHLLHESNGFSAYLSEAAAVQKAFPKLDCGTITDHAEDVFMDDPVLHLFVPMEYMVRFVEEITSVHSVALVDVILADKVHAARYVMYAYFARRQQTTNTDLTHFNPGPEAFQIMAGGNYAPDPAKTEEMLRAALGRHDGCSRWGIAGELALKGVQVAKAPAQEEFDRMVARGNRLSIPPYVPEQCETEDQVNGQILEDLGLEEKDFWG